MKTIIHIDSFSYKLFPDSIEFIYVCHGTQSVHVVYWMHNSQTPDPRTEVGLLTARAWFSWSRLKFGRGLRFFLGEESGTKVPVRKNYNYYHYYSKMSTIQRRERVPNGPNLYVPLHSRRHSICTISRWYWQLIFPEQSKKYSTHTRTNFDWILIPKVQGFGDMCNMHV